MRKIKYAAALLVAIIFITACQASELETRDSLPESSTDKIEQSIDVEATQEVYTDEVYTYEVYTYELYTELSEDMPEYHYIVTGKASGTDEWSIGFVTGLEIYDENKLSILSVDFTQDFEGNPIYYNMMDTMGLHVVDVNFDGYKDVIVLSSFSGAHSNTWYECWLWDAETLTYVYSETFTEICNPAINQYEQCIYSSGGSGAGKHSYSIYKFIEDEFIISNSLYWEWAEYVMLPEQNYLTATGIQLTEKRLENGTMEIVFDRFVPDEEADDLLEAYNKEDPWLLDSPRWYMLGGHHADEWLETQK